MANKNLVLRLLISAKDEASGVLSSMQAKAAAVAAAIASYFTIDFLSGSVKSAAAFEQAMSRVQAATGSAGEELALLKKTAEDAGSSTSYTSVQAAGALENLAKAGLNANQAVAALPGVLALAAAGDIDLAHSAEIVTRTIAGMGVAVEDTGRIADVLAKGANASNTSVKGLAEALSYTAPTARSAKLSLEQTVAILGKFADGGIDASRAGTALNAILSQFIDPASKFRSELVSLGIITTDFDKALHQLAASGDKGSKAILAVGTEAGPALRSLINQGLPALDGLKAQLDGAAGSAAATAATMNANLNGALTGLSSAWESLKIKLGEPVLPVVTQAVKDLTAGLREGVANGSVGKFGDALRSAFSSGIEWVRKFAAEADPAALTAKLQEMANKAGAWFDDMSEKARNAGDILRTAYGVMSAGANAVMAAVYKISEAFAGVSRDMLLGIANIAEAFAKMTFGGLSASFKAAADEIRIAAGGMGAVSEEYARQANKAFGAAVEGAELARKGWAGLTAPAEEATKKVAEVGKAATLTADQLDAAGEGATFIGGKLTELATKASASGKAQTDAAQKSTEAIAALRAEYAALIAVGDTTKAGEKLLEINAALRAASGNAKSAADETLQYQRALTEATAAAERHVTAERAAAGLAQQALQNDKYRAETILAVARQRGKEKDIAEAQIEVWRIELQINEAQAVAAKAEAESMALVTKAKRVELEATGELTEAKKAELAVADANVRSKQLEAEKYDLVASRMRALSNETAELKSGFGDLSSAADEAAAAADRAAGSYDGLRSSISGAASARSSWGTDTSGNVRSEMVLTPEWFAEQLKSTGVDEVSARRAASGYFDSYGHIQNLGGETIDVAIRREAERLTGVGAMASATPVVQTVKVVQVDLRTNSGTQSISVVGEDSVDTLLRALESSQLASR